MPVKKFLNSKLQNQVFDSMKIPSLNWGISNEKKACNQYVEIMQGGDTSYNFKYDKCGLFVNTTFAHLGASPDGVITSDCYGTGLVEIECLYKFRDVRPEHIYFRS